jgi:Tir chaperone protein (CesT) family
MSTTTPTLEKLLTDSGLAEKSQEVDKNLVRMQWGSAFVLVGISGSAIVAIAPLFREPPHDKATAFYKKLLEHNAYMGGMASFAIQTDGWVILHAGRAIKGMDANEFATMVAGVGRFADQFDDQLIAEFYADQPEATNQATVQ